MASIFLSSNRLQTVFENADKISIPCSAPISAVCRFVCVTLRAKKFSLFEAGGPGLSQPTWPNEAGMDRGSNQGRLGVYLQNNCCSRCLLSWFASMVVLMIDPKTGFPC